MTTPVPAAEHAWLPKASCDASCIRVDAVHISRPFVVVLRTTVRLVMTMLLLPALPLLAVPLPGKSRIQRLYCRLMLRCLGVRISVSGGPIRNLSGVLVVAGHVSWVDIFAIGAVMPGSFVARADLIEWPALGFVARLLKVIPIDRHSLRGLPDVVRTVGDRLSAGQTVVAFPEGTTWCGLGHGTFAPAMFQAAIDTGRPVQPLQLTYRHRNGAQSTIPAFIGDDSLLTSIKRVITAKLTVCHMQVQSLQLPGTDRRDLAGRCQAAVQEVGPLPVAAVHGHTKAVWQAA
ncbi:lysophospholipid acyltransferase family protein [Mycolicibacterium phocaicum]|uniref:lysophospholipid acyltransferase family protein n=1 Tax=Mycolicibacterium phocaicum TaxID=319706 RepID=UPI0011D50B29|nr:lysophospholipid acyltransferase family protein [Mycolicibacterium phocaicum]TXH23064.1 MAG: 1-acyl-sn-glycerol-3-phosphate acyltransferase [Mycobacterium sp.]UCZ58494.1 1-acyl-sn-glycerol-3-phosphate acyltransferase [Mycolicibacterium phocaicum]